MPCPLESWRRTSPLSLAAAVESHPPVETLLATLRSGRAPYLATTAAALMVVQWERLGWPLPHLLIPMPDPDALWKKSLARQITEALATFWKRPLGAALGMEPEGATYFLKRNVPLADKCLMLVDLRLEKTPLLHHAAYTLQEHAPQKIYALTFTRWAPIPNASLEYK